MCAFVCFKCRFSGPPCTRGPHLVSSIILSFCSDRNFRHRDFYAVYCPDQLVHVSKVSLCLHTRWCAGTHHFAKVLASIFHLITSMYLLGCLGSASQVASLYGGNIELLNAELELKYGARFCELRFSMIICVHACRQFVSHGIC